MVAPDVHKIGAALALALSVLSTLSYWRSHRHGGDAPCASSDAPSVRWFRYVYRFVQWIVPIAAILILADAPSWALAWPVPTLLAITGMVVAVLGFALFGWSKVCLGSAYAPCFDARAPQHVVARGPYRAIRHPIYTANILALTGLALATGSVWIALAGVLVTAGYAASAPREESALSAAHPTYVELMATTGRFLPRVRRRA